MTETKTERLDCMLRALQERDPGDDEELALTWAFELRTAALFLEGAPPELFEAARRRFELYEAVHYGGT